jgi:hypothetical protein
MGEGAGSRVFTLLSRSDGRGAGGEGSFIYQIANILHLVSTNLGLSDGEDAGDTELAQLLGCEPEFITKLKNWGPNNKLSVHKITRLALMFGKVPVIEFRNTDPEKDYMGGVVIQVEELTAILRARIPKKK